MEWVSSKPHMSVEHSISSTIQTLPADAHTLAASSQLTCHACQVTEIHSFHRKTKSSGLEYSLLAVLVMTLWAP